MKKGTLFASIVTLAFVSCTATIDKNINGKNFETDVSEISKSHKEYTEADFKELKHEMSFVLIGMKATGKNTASKTYKEVLDGIKEKREAKEAKMAEYKKKMEELRNQVSVRVIEKKYYKGEFDYKGNVGLAIAISNGSGKAVNAFEGVLRVNDLMGNNLMNAKITNSKTIEAGGTINESNWYKIGFGNDSEADLQNIPLEKLQFIWEPSKIVFTDGSSLEAPEKPSTD